MSVMESVASLLLSSARALSLSLTLLLPLSFLLVLNGVTLGFLLLTGFATGSRPCRYTNVCTEYRGMDKFYVCFAAPLVAV